MHEYILAAVLPGNEAVTLSVAEPFYCSCDSSCGRLGHRGGLFASFGSAARVTAAQTKITVHRIRLMVVSFRENSSVKGRIFNPLSQREWFADAAVRREHPPITNGEAYFGIGVTPPAPS